MPKMWHNVGLTLLVFVATLLIVLLLMVCGEWASPRGGYTLRCTRRLDWSCRPAGFVWLKRKKKGLLGKCVRTLFCPLTSRERARRDVPQTHGRPAGILARKEQDPGLGILTRG